MKWLIVCVALAVLGLTSAAPQDYDDDTDMGKELELLNDLQGVQVMDNHNIGTQSHLNHERAESQFLGLATGLLAPMLAPVVKNLGKKAIKSIAGCSENNENAQSLSYRGDLSKRHADLKAIIEVMKNINAATKKVSELQRNMMKDNQVVDQADQAEIMGIFSSIWGHLKDAGSFLGGAAKKLICSM